MNFDPIKQYEVYRECPSCLEEVFVTIYVYEDNGSEAFWECPKCYSEVVEEFRTEEYEDYD